MKLSRRNTGLAALATAALMPAASAHTWVEQARKIAPNGTMVGALGFQRAFVGRADPAFKDASNMLRSNSVIGPGDKICKDPVGSYANPAFPQLKVSAGDFIALQYLENGHVSQPFTQPTKPANRGTVFVYGTAEPRDDDTILGVHLQWTRDGAGGDGRGRLLATRNFDDGQCYEANAAPISQQRQQQFKKPVEQPMGNNLWCQTDLQLPSDLAKGSYTLYWVWDWPLLDGDKIDVNSTANGNYPSGNLAGSDPRVKKAETYTSCLDLQVVAAASGGPGFANNLASQDKFDSDQDLTFAAIASQLKDNFDVPLFGNDNDNGNKDSPVDNNPAVPAPSNTAGSDDAVTTVVVTAPPVTVTNFITVFRDGASLSTASPQVTAAPKPAPAQDAGPPSVSPFLKARGRKYQRI